MGLICKDCGCDDIRHDKLLGYHCNNCSCRDFTRYDRSNPSEYAKELIEKYKQSLSET